MTRVLSSAHQCAGKLASLIALPRRSVPHCRPAVRWLAHERVAAGLVNSHFVATVDADVTGTYDPPTPSSSSSSCGSSLSSSASRRTATAISDSRLEKDLGSVLDELEESLRPTAEQLTRREALLAGLQEICASLGGIVRVFGSCENGTETKSSDVDITWVHPCLEECTLPHRKAMEAAMLKGMRTRIDAAGFDVVGSTQVVPSARVPVLKLLGKDGDCLCDVTMNNWEGLRNTMLVKSLCKELPNLAPVVRLLKYWCQQRGISDRWRGGFSTYTLVLMASHLQLHPGKVEGCAAPASSAVSGAAELVRRLCAGIEQTDWQEALGCDVRPAAGQRKQSAELPPPPPAGSASTAASAPPPHACDERGAAEVFVHFFKVFSKEDFSDGGRLWLHGGVVPASVAFSRSLSTGTTPAASPVSMPAAGQAAAAEDVAAQHTVPAPPPSSASPVPSALAPQPMPPSPPSQPAVSAAASQPCSAGEARAPEVPAPPTAPAAPAVPPAPKASKPVLRKLLAKLEVFCPLTGQDVQRSTHSDFQRLFAEIRTAAACLDESNLDASSLVAKFFHSKPAESPASVGAPSDEATVLTCAADDGVPPPAPQLPKPPPPPGSDAAPMPATARPRGPPDFVPAPPGASKPPPPPASPAAGRRGSKEIQAGTLSIMAASAPSSARHACPS
eukprot:TRINITY_DN15952_c0_g1_i1.p1 TRINITY_DN15952_c0_g1~~TRINITY_DN15952_c0_g1_i1.p1  ORF type:complete len:674 (-),score=142.51 TRINITY_DN15952_c0_g1_i1:66-2087(-)